MLRRVALVRTEVPPKHRFSGEPNGATSQKTPFFVVLLYFTLLSNSVKWGRIWQGRLWIKKCHFASGGGDGLEYM
jgi:hypothetical protein